MISDTPVIHHPNKTVKEKRYDGYMYCTVGAFKDKYLLSLSPYKLSRMWGIGLKSAIKTLYGKTHNISSSTGLLSKRFRTDKAQLRYKYISRWYGTFYVDYLKMGVKSVRQFIEVTFYTNKLGSKKFSPFSNLTSSETRHTLRVFIELVVLPPKLHSDNHNNFKKGLLNQLL